MRGRKLQTLLCAALLGVSLWLPGQVSAEVRTVEADGFYQMGDGMAENQAIAKERARVDAIRSAGEQVAVYMESDTVVSKNIVIRDDIRFMTAAVLEVKSITCTPEIVGEAVRYRCHVVAVVDTDNVIKKIKQDNNSLKFSIKRYMEENERLRRDMDELKSQYKAATPQQKAELDIKIKKNDTDFEANSYMKKGIRYFWLRQYIKAAECFEKTIDLKPDYAEAYGSLGMVYGAAGDSKAAIDYLSKAIAINPNSAEMYNALGGRYFTYGDTKSAMASYEKAIGIRPNLASPYSNMGIAYLKLGDKQQALDYLSKAVYYDPNYAEAYSSMGMIYCELGDNEKAVECCEKAISCDPGLWPAYCNLAAAYRNLGDTKRADEYYEKACEIYPPLRKLGK